MPSVREFALVTLVVLAAACTSKDRPESSSPSYDATAVKLAVDGCERALTTAGSVFSKQVVEYRIDSLIRSDRAEAARLLPLTIEGIFTSVRMPCDLAVSIVETEARKAKSSTELSLPRHRVATAMAKLDAAQKLYQELLAAARAPQAPADIEAAFERLEHAIYALPN
jgi:hypothetical protein